MLLDGSPPGSPWCAAICNAENLPASNRHSTRTCSEPVSRSYNEPTTSTNTTRPASRSSSRTHPRLRAGWQALQELYSLYLADDRDGALEALDRFTDLYATGELGEFHAIVDTIINWGDEILAWHSAGRPSNGRIEGTNNLLQVLRRVAHGFTNPRQLRRPRTPRDMITPPKTSGPIPTNSRRANLLQLQRNRAGGSHSDRGVTLVEYALVVSLLVVTSIASFESLDHKIGRALHGDG